MGWIEREDYVHAIYPEYGSSDPNMDQVINRDSLRCHDSLSCIVYRHDD